MKTWHKVLAVLMAASAVPAQAQWTNPHTGTTWNNPMSSYLDTVNMGNQRMANLMMMQDLQNPNRKSKSKKPSAKRGPQTKRKTPSSTTSTAAPVATDFQKAVKATSFKYSGSSKMPKLLSAMMFRDAKAEKSRASASELMAHSLEAARTDLRRNTKANLPVDNVARALAYFVTSSYALSVTRNGETIGQRLKPLSASQMDALRVQAALALNAEPKFRAQPDSRKQELYDMLLIMSTSAEYIYIMGLQKKNANVQNEARNMARNNLKELLGANHETMRFTATGVQF